MSFKKVNLARARTAAYRLSTRLQLLYYRGVWGMHIGDGVRISRSAKLDKTNPKGMYIGDYTLVSFDAAVLTHDFLHGRHVDTRIGSYCFIGARSIIMPGVKIGDHCIVGAGAVVTADVPPRSLVVGNPAKIARSGIDTGKWGILNIGSVRPVTNSTDTVAKLG